MANFTDDVERRRKAKHDRDVELKQGLETIDLKMSLTEPKGGSANEGADSGIAHRAERTAWEALKKRSKDYAIKQHKIKYQLPDDDSFGGDSTGNMFTKL